MTIKMTPPKTANHMVNFLHKTTGNMNEVSRASEIPVNILWTAKKNRSYAFRTPIYMKGLKSAYMDFRDFEEFPEFIEDHLTSLRNAYELAGAEGQKANGKPLSDLLCSLWPLINHNAGDFSGSQYTAGLHYLSGTMMLVADLRKLNCSSFPKDKVTRAIEDFTAAGEILNNPALRHRALISMISARQRKAHHEGKGFLPLDEVLDRRELQFLQKVQARQTDNSVTDALNGVKLASVLRMKDAMCKAESDLLLHDSRFIGQEFEGWSPISPATDDPDLAFYRKTKSH